MEGGYQCFGGDAYPEDGGGIYNLSSVTAHMIIIYIRTAEVT
jgi:hypothetical protein